MYTRTRTSGDTSHNTLLEYGDVETSSAVYDLQWTYVRNYSLSWPLRYTVTLSVGALYSATGSASLPTPVGSVTFDAADDRTKPTLEVNKLISLQVGGSVAVTTSEREVVYISRHTNNVISDVNTPDFKKRIAVGEIINNPCSNKRESLNVHHSYLAKAPQGQLSYSTYNGRIIVSLAPEEDRFYDIPELEESSATVVSTLRSLTIEDNNELATVINKSFAGLNDGALALAVELGEGRETLTYIVTVARRVAELIYAVKRGHWRDLVPNTYRKLMRKAKRLSRKKGTTVAYEAANLITDFAASAWLEVRFAIRPLLISAEQAVDVHNNGIKERTGRFTVNHRSQVPTTLTWKEEFLAGGVDVNVVYSVDRLVSYSAGVMAQADPSSTMLRTLGFTNLAGIAWELTFLSWAMDYFVNTDGFFYQITPNIGVDPLASWSSVKVEYKGSADVIYTAPDGTEILKSTISVNDISYLRTPVTHPTLMHWDVDLDIPKITDLVALIKVLTSSKPKNDRFNLLNYGVIK